MSKSHQLEEFTPAMEPESGVPSPQQVLRDYDLPESPQTLKRKKDFDKDITNDMAMTSNNGSPSRSPEPQARDTNMRFYPEDEEPKSQRTHQLHHLDNSQARGTVTSQYVSPQGLRDSVAQTRSLQMSSQENPTGTPQDILKIEEMQPELFKIKPKGGPIGFETLEKELMQQKQSEQKQLEEQTNLNPNKIEDPVLNLDYVENCQTDLRTNDHKVVDESSQKQRQELSEPQIVILTQRKQDKSLIQQMAGQIEGVFTTSSDRQYQIETQTSSAKRYTLMQLKQMTKSKLTEKDLIYKQKRKGAKILTPITSKSKDTRATAGATAFPSRNHTRQDYRGHLDRTQQISVAGRSTLVQLQDEDELRSLQQHKAQETKMRSTHASADTRLEEFERPKSLGQSQASRFARPNIGVNRMNYGAPPGTAPGKQRIRTQWPANKVGSQVNAEKSRSRGVSIQTFIQQNRVLETAGPGNYRIKNLIGDITDNFAQMQAKRASMPNYNVLSQGVGSTEHDTENNLGPNQRDSRLGVTSLDLPSPGSLQLLQNEKVGHMITGAQQLPFNILEDPGVSSGGNIRANQRQLSFSNTGEEFNQSNSPVYSNKNFQSQMIQKRSKQKASSLSSACGKIQKNMRNEDRTKELGMKIDQIRKMNGKRAIRTYLQAQQKEEQQRKSQIADLCEQRRILEEGGHLQFVEFNQNGSQFDKQALVSSHLNKIRVANIDTNKRAGMSVFHQDTFENFFKAQTLAMTYRKSQPDLYMPNTAVPSSPKLESKPSEKGQDPPVTPPDCITPGLNQSIDKVRELDLKRASELRSSRDQGGSQINSVRSSRLNELKPFDPILLRSRMDGPPKYFKRENRNPMHIGASKYSHENYQVRDICSRDRKSQKSTRQAPVFPQEASNSMNTTEDYGDTLQKNLPLLLNSSAAQPARLIPQQRKTTNSQRSDEKSHSQTFDMTSSPQNFQDKETGLWMKPVSASMIDIEDLIYNKQFHKTAGLNTETLVEKYKHIVKKRAEKFMQQKKENVFQNQKKPVQMCSSILDVVVSEKMQMKVPEYMYKHNIDQAPKTKQQETLGALDYKPQQIYESEINLNNESMVQVNQSVATRPGAKSRLTSQDDTENHTLTLNSSAERLKREELGWKNENDHLFDTEGYMIKVQPRNAKRGKKQFRQLETTQFQSVPQFIGEVDKLIDLKKKQGPGTLGTITNFMVRKQAQDLYMLINGCQTISIYDQGYKSYILDVFRLFPEDPLKNDKVKCGIKGIVKNFHDEVYEGAQYDKYKNIPKKEEEMVECTHVHEDDAELQKYYRIQIWFLDFYKHMYKLLLNSEISKDHQLQEELGREAVAKLNEAIDEKQKKIEQITQSISSEAVLNSKKISRRGLAIDNITRNFQEFANTLQEAEKDKLYDFLTVKKLINDPIVKMMIINKPQKAIEYSEKSVDKKVIEFGGSGEIHLNQLCHQVFEIFGNEVLKVKRMKNVTFKNANSSAQEKFCMTEQETILKNLKKIMVEQAENDAKVQFQDLLAEKSEILNDEGPSIEMLDPNAAGRQAATMRKNEDEADAQDVVPSQARKEVQYMSRRDMIFQLFNIITAGETVELVKQYDSIMQDKIQNKIAAQFRELKTMTLEKRNTKSIGSIAARSQTATAKGSLNEEASAISKELTLEMKINLYNQVRQDKEKHRLELHKQQDRKFSFYDKAKQLILGTEDNFGGTEIEYFKMCRSQQIYPKPILFKFINNNLFHIKGVRINMGQAIAIKDALTQAMKPSSISKPKSHGDVSDDENDEFAMDEKKLRDPEHNPFLIKTLVIDDCGMSDEVFAQILMGLDSQPHIRSIHYVNNNELGPESTEVLKKICARSQGNPLLELNLSNIKVLQAAQNPDLKTPAQRMAFRREYPEEMFGVLVQITQELEPLMKLQRLKLSNLDLNDPEMIQNLCDLLQNPYITYYNLAYSNIQTRDLVTISAELTRCTNLEYLSLGGNKITSNGLPKAEYEASVDEFIGNLCDFIELPQSSLRFLDVSDMALRTKEYRAIFKALQKNTMLESVNLGAIHDPEDRALLQKMLGIKNTKIEFSFRPQKQNEKESQLSLKDFYLNAGLGKWDRNNKSLRESMFMAQDSSMIRHEQEQVILNRYSRNAEMISDPREPVEGYDSNYCTQWTPVKHCFYANRYRYTQVYYNQSDIELNKMEELRGQNEFKRVLKDLYKNDQNKAGNQVPLVIMDGKVFPMMDPIVYAALLSLNQILVERKAQLAKQPFGAIEVTGINLNQNNLQPHLKRQQDELNEILATLTISEIREHICDYVKTPLTTNELETMSVHQLTIMKNFVACGWLRTIDQQFNEANNQYISVVNQQYPEVNRQLIHTLDSYIAKGNKSQQSQAQSSGQTAKSGSRMDEGSRMSSISKVNSTIEKDSLKQGSIQSNNFTMDPENINLAIQKCPAYVVGGYLPPGRNHIYIYDRENDKIFHQEILTQMGSLAPGTTPTDGAQFKFLPEPMGEEQALEIEEKYAEAVEEQRLIDAAKREKERQAYLLALEMKGASKKKKGGKKKK